MKEFSNPNNRPSDAPPPNVEGGNVGLEVKALMAQLDRAERAAVALYSRLAPVLVLRNDECGSGNAEPKAVRCDLADVVAMQWRRVSSLAQGLEELAAAVDL